MSAKKKARSGAPIILYHFCAARDVRSVLREGLTKGMTPIFKDGEPRMMQRTQWLTADKDPERQSWNTRHLVQYSRTAYRLTVSIPYSRRKKLVKATEFIKILTEENAALVRDWAGSESWYIFFGNIPPEWILGFDKMKEDDGR